MTDRNGVVAKEERVRAHGMNADDESWRDSSILTEERGRWERGKENSPGLISKVDWCF
jgi:hypothetical protein